MDRAECRCHHRQSSSPADGRDHGRDPADSAGPPVTSSKSLHRPTSISGDPTCICCCGVVPTPVICERDARSFYEHLTVGETAFALESPVATRELLQPD